MPIPGSGPNVDVDVLLAVASAIRDHQQLRADYIARDDEESRRVLEPHRVVHSGRRWYLVAWDVERRNWRTFRLDLLSPHAPTGPRFTPRQPPEPDIARYTSHGITTDAYRYRCRLTVMAPGQVVRADIAPTDGVVTPLDQDTCELVTGSNYLDEVALHVGLIGHEIVVHEPPSSASTWPHSALGSPGLRATPAQGRALTPSRASHRLTDSGSVAGRSWRPS